MILSFFMPIYPFYYHRSNSVCVIKIFSTFQSPDSISYNSTHFKYLKSFVKHSLVVKQSFYSVRMIRSALHLPSQTFYLQVHIHAAFIISLTLSCTSLMISSWCTVLELLTPLLCTTWKVLRLSSMVSMRLPSRSRAERIRLSSFL